MASAPWKLAKPLAAGLALVACAVLLGTAGGGQGASAASPSPACAHEQDFREAAAGIYGRIQMLRQLEREMLAHAINPDRRAHYRAQRDAARQRIDELYTGASEAAASDAERRRLAQLAALTAVADARFGSLLVATDPARPVSPLAELTE